MRTIVLVVTSACALLWGSGCNPTEKAAEAEGSSNSGSPSANKKTDAKKAPAACGDGAHRNEKMGYCVAKLPEGAGAKDVTDLGQGRTIETLFSKEGRTARVEASSDTMDWQMSGLDNVSKAPGNKELERGDIFGKKGKFVIAQEDACKCDRITAVVPAGKGTVTCMATVPTGTPRHELFEVCKSLQAL